MPNDTNKYRVVNGTYYRDKTPQAVVDILESHRNSGRRIAIHYGYTEHDGGGPTGRDWLEEYDMRGKAGRSTGRIKVPLIIPDDDSGGPAVLDHCIVRIRDGRGRDAYRHPQYHHGRITIGPPNNDHVKTCGHCGHTQGEIYRSAVYVDGSLHVQFGRHDDAARWCRHMGLTVSI